MRIVLEVDDGEVTFTVRPAGQAGSKTAGAIPTQAGTNDAVDFGSASFSTVHSTGAKPGRDAGPAPQIGAPRRLGATSTAVKARNTIQAAEGASARPQGEGKAAKDAGPAPRGRAAGDKAAPPAQAGESFNLMGGAGRNAGPAPTLRSRRKINPSNGGKSK